MERYTFHVDGMECRGCEHLLDREIGSVEDVHRTDVDHETGIVELDAADPETSSYVEHLVRDLGYDVTAVE